jgi:predicted metalloprotease with PDZ domain
MGGRGWPTWRRGSDYYDEGDLLWLQVATIIHEQSMGQSRSTIFARLFMAERTTVPR